MDHARYSICLLFKDDVHKEAFNAKTIQILIKMGSAYTFEREWFALRCPVNFVFVKNE